MWACFIAQRHDRRRVSPPRLRQALADRHPGVEVSLLVRRHNRSPIVDQILRTVPAVSEELGWI